jgi:hypothetical protein
MNLTLTLAKIPEANYMKRNIRSNDENGGWNGDEWSASCPSVVRPEKGKVAECSADKSPFCKGNTMA